MSTIDKNKIFFGLIHYILSEQKNVNWLIKSSLIDITGVNSLLEEKPYKTDSILDDVIDYITEIKPYHVQFSHYFEHYQTAKETVKIPKRDWIEPTIGLTFDAIKSTPDVFLFDEIVDSLPSTETEIGYIVFNKTDNRFYKLIKENNEFVWKELNEDLTDDRFYCTLNPKNFYKVVEENDIFTLDKCSNDDIKEFVNRHRANRLFYIQYWNNGWMPGGIDVFDEIKKELNANFKGLELNGSVFDIEKFGYDIFNYDTTDYDSPTIVYDYYFVKKYDENFIIVPGTHETFLDYEFIDGYNNTNTSNYEISFVEAGTHRFSLGEHYKLTEARYKKVYKVSKTGVISEYNNYDIQENAYIDVFTSLGDGEKIYVVLFNNEDKIKYVNVLEASSFIPSEADVLRRRFVYMDDNNEENYYLPIPSTEINSSEKIAVQLKSNRSNQPFLNFKAINGEIIINKEYIREFNHIVMTQFDYKYLYDKIYSWEDRYGRSNNIVNLDGNNFLRALYEEDRPSEKIVSYPQNTLFIYKNDDNSSSTYIFMKDYKNHMKYTNVNKNSGIHLYKEPERYSDGTIKSLYVKKYNNFTYPSGYAMINSEILEYKTIEPCNVDEYYKLTNLSRGLFGTPITDIDDEKYSEYTIMPYINKNWYTKESKQLYKSYGVTSSNIYDYNSPSGYGENLEIKLSKLPKINLLEDVTGNSTEIYIDSANVIYGSKLIKSNGDVVSTEWYDIPNTQAYQKKLYEYVKENNNGELFSIPYGYFVLKINDDIVKFTKINKVLNTQSKYRLSGIILPKKYINYGDKIVYSANKSFVYSCIQEDINSFLIKYIEGDYTYKIVPYPDDDSSGEIEYYLVQTNDGVNRFKIINDKVFEFNTAPTFDNPNLITENLFGNIKKDEEDNLYVYKTNGSIFARIKDDEFISIQTIVSFKDDDGKILENLEKGESLYININEIED